MGQVVEDVGWRGVRIDRPGSAGSNGKPAAYPVARGTVIGLGPKEALLWTRASATEPKVRGSNPLGRAGGPRSLSVH